MDNSYSAPSITELGTVAELTLTVNSSTFFDSNVRGGQSPTTPNITS